MTDNALNRPRTEDEPMNVNDWERQAQDRAEAHLEACRQALFHEDEHDPSVTCEHCPPLVSSAPYCDCTRCCVRETLHAAWPILAEMAVAEYMSLPRGGTPSWRRSS